MSRRTKIILTALFLVLLGIPAAYIVLTWRLENPLRFRVVGECLEHMPPYEGQLRVLTVEIENTSAATVGIRGCYLGDAADTPKPILLGMMDGLIETEGPRLPPASIGAHGTVLREFVFEEGVPLDKPLHEVIVWYTWNTRMAVQADALVMWLWDVLPRSIGGKLSRPHRKYGRAPLEPSP
jgi:hypothetical protein